MTDNGYLPFIMAKLIACTECADSAAKLIRDLATFFDGAQLTMNTLITLGESVDRSVSYNSRFEKIEAIQEELGEAYYLPWFLQCNQERYPSWYGKVDARLYD